MAVPYIPGAMVTVVRRRYLMVTDEYHNQVRSPIPAELPISDCCFQPKSGSEYLTDTDRFTVRGDLYLPPEADLLGTDTVVVPGYGEFEVDGPVQRWPDVGGLGHTYAALVWFQEASGTPAPVTLDGGNAAAIPTLTLDGGAP